jgi:phospho-N-acetylmuramoyl-pentapeptide-transferase
VNCSQFDGSHLWSFNYFPWFWALIPVGAAIAALVIPLVIRWQRRAALGQQVYEDGPAAHLAKQGTPTMGGLAFPVATLLTIPLSMLPAFAATAAVVSGGTIGFIDDFIKVRLRRALGLRARWKLLALTALAFFVATVSDQRISAARALYGCDSGYHLGFQYQWWFGSLLSLPYAVSLILAVLAVVGCANSVNLTDGVDGLAASTVLPPLIVLTALTGSDTAAVVLGALVVFLLFNLHPAKVFMGDTGSLALGTLLAALAIDAHVLLFLPLLGIVFVVEALSVIAQVVSFKLTGKRIFKMSPLHHHFELSGWSEKKVTAVFSAVSVLASAAFCVIVYLSNLRIPPH